MLETKSDLHRYLVAADSIEDELQRSNLPAREDVDVIATLKQAGYLSLEVGVDPWCVSKMYHDQCQRQVLRMTRPYVQLLVFFLCTRISTADWNCSPQRRCACGNRTPQTANAS